MAKKLRSNSTRRRTYSLIFVLVLKIFLFIPMFFIAIGDSVLWITGRFLNLLNDTFFNLRRFFLFHHFFPRKKTVFNYKTHNRKVLSQQSRSPKPLPISLLTKIKYLIAGIIFSFFFIFLPLVAIVFIQDLPSPSELSLQQIPQTTKIYDRNGVLLQQIFAQQNRTLVPLNDIPQNLQNATIAIEDKNFYKHPGFDLPSIVRAFYEDLTGKPIQGGSTITQQLIKSSLLTSERSISRKFKEIILAFWAERLYTKDQILGMYFNQVPYGGTAWGIEAASEVYFNENVKNLDLAQSALLAGLTAAPTSYSPFGDNGNLWKKRQIEVLDKMVDNNFITQQQAETAAKEKLTFATQSQPLFAPHFVNYVTDYLEQKYGPALVERGGLIVKTSIDIRLQNQVQQIVANEVANDAYLNLTNGAALITDPTNGDILAMVGSHDFNDPNGGNVNLATSLRQPGSSIKVVTYSAAFQRGFTAETILDDSPVTYTNPWGQSYSPVNYDGRFHGRVPLRIALANSFNVPAVKTLNQIGVPAMVNLGKEMGIQSWGDPSQYGLSITLGSADVTMLDMATVYGTLANNGNRVDPNPILSITDYKGDVLEEKDNSKIPSTSVLDPGITYILSDILADNNSRTLEFGPNSPLYIPGHYIPVKTGTTDDKRDNWTDGYTKNYVVIVWVGNNDNSPMSPALASGITGAAPIWNKIMSSLDAGVPNNAPPMPSDVVQKNCNGRKEYFIAGTENSVSCSYVPSPTPTPGH
ncbi:MAG TPA: transglycosylase domain-containing protein [Patescibacteria group bacterium]|nr:transglycosylase domain-containing protein [Patescibacteria group bacterium]